MITKLRLVLCDYLSSLRRMDFAFECLVYFSSVILVLSLKKDVAGSRFDSQFYISNFSWIATNHQIIPLDQYEVASSPIFVHLMGILTFIFGDYSTHIIHGLYLFMALFSIGIILRILGKTKVRKRIALSSLLVSSGYFVAPSLWPTSDTPAILFMLLSYYFYFSRPSSWLFSFSLFALLSTRQSFAWLCIGFLIFDLMKIQVHTLKNIGLVFTKYLPSLGSLLVTFFYFDFEFTPKFYEDSQSYNVYHLPNFLSTIQIGLNLIVVLLPIILFAPAIVYRNRINASDGIFLITGGLLAFGVFLNLPKKEIAVGLSWLSIAKNQANISLQITALIAFAGFIIYFRILSKVDHVLRLFLFLSFVLLCLSSLLMAIPFLRYFEISSFFILILTISEIDKRYAIKDSFWLPISACLIFINWLKIFA